MLSLKIKPNSPILLLCLLVVVLLSGCSRRKATLDQSKKALKAFDYEMIQITKRLADTEAFEALMLIRRLPGIQLPFITSNDTIAGSGLSTFNMKRANGVYEYHSTDSLPEKISDSDSLIILYKNPKNQSKSYKLIVKSFHETLTEIWELFSPTTWMLKFIRTTTQSGKSHFIPNLSMGFRQHLILLLMPEE
ncbi:MAG: hypothetical protein M9948_11945 [Lentimicrobium sp.]|nr:hypothetical protein [Lentimicrobium sp.]